MVSIVTDAVLIAMGFVFADLTQGLNLTFGIVARISTVWALALGIVISRKAW